MGNLALHLNVVRSYTNKTPESETINIINSLVTSVNSKFSWKFKMIKFDKNPQTSTYHYYRYENTAENTAIFLKILLILWYWNKSNCVRKVQRWRFHYVLTFEYQLHYRLNCTTKLVRFSSWMRLLDLDICKNKLLEIYLYN